MLKLDKEPRGWLTLGVEIVPIAWADVNEALVGVCPPFVLPDARLPIADGKLCDKTPCDVLVVKKFRVETDESDVKVFALAVGIGWKEAVPLGGEVLATLRVDTRLPDGVLAVDCVEDDGPLMLLLIDVTMLEGGMVSAVGIFVDTSEVVLLSKKLSLGMEEW